MLLIVEKGIRVEICHSIYKYAKANNKYMKNNFNIKHCHIFNTGIWIIYMVVQWFKTSSNKVWMDWRYF